MSRSNQPSVPVAVDATERFRVTHPFHPLHGRELELVDHRLVWNKDRAYYDDDDGRLRSLPTRWTSLCPADPFEVVAAGRARFRPEDLLRLAERVEALRTAANTAK